MIVVDIEKFGMRSDLEQGELRARLYQVTESALEAVGISPDNIPDPTDRGDGAFWILPSTTSKTDLTGPFVHRLHQELKRDAADRRTRMRLRVSLHAGKVRRDHRNWFGTDLNTACRLVDAEELRQALRENEHALLALIMSHEWRQAVQGRPIREFDLADCRQVGISTKELNCTAWIHVPASRPPAGPAQLPGEMRERLRRVAAQVERVRFTEQEVRERHEHVAKRIRRVPPMPAPAAVLRPEHPLAPGRWDALPAHQLAELDVTGYERAARQWEERLGEHRRHIDELLTERNELRRFLDVNRARQNQRGLAEDLELGECYRRAHDLLWIAPCDLPAARTAVEDYLKTLRHKLYSEPGEGHGRLP